MGCNWDEEGARGKMLSKGQKERILKSMVAQSYYVFFFKIFFPSYPFFF